MNIDCLCAGIIVADFICAPVARVPPAGGLVMTDGISLEIGGCASNVAVDLCRLGRRAAVVGRVGADVPGRFVRDALRSAGVETSSVVESAGEQTSATLVINVRGEDRRFIHTFGANAAFDGSEVSAELLSRARCLYVGGFLLMPRFKGAQLARLFETARAAGVPTILDVVIPDPAGCWEELTRVLPLTDVFLPNTDEARQLLGREDPVEQAERFHAAGAKTVVVTCGAGGAILISPSERIRAGAFRVPFVDGTGSGDAFAAGYIDGLLEGRTPAECLERGSALGASCVRRAGATTGVFTRRELEEFLSGERLRVEGCSPPSPTQGT